MTLYEYRKANGLCVSCGEIAKPGRTRCIRCSQIYAVKEQERRKHLTPEQEERRKEYQRFYAKNHPVSKEKRSEYNRQYRERNSRCMMKNQERWFNWNGERIRLPELAKRVGIPYGRLYNRIFKDGMSLSEAIIRG